MVRCKAAAFAAELTDRGSNLVEFFRVRLRRAAMAAAVDSGFGGARHGWPNDIGTIVPTAIRGLVK